MEVDGQCFLSGRMDQWISTRIMPPTKKALVMWTGNTGWDLMLFILSLPPKPTSCVVMSMTGKEDKLTLSMPPFLWLTVQMTTG